MNKIPDHLDPYKYMTVREHRIGGVYTKECHLPVGYAFPQHRHRYEHTSVLASGTALVEVDGVTTEHVGPVVLRIEAKKVHTITPLTPCVWLCQHATTSENEDIDAELIDHG